LVDVLRRWCGDVAAVCASANAMPARDLAGSPVTLSLLMTSGATVLVSEHDTDPVEPDRAVITLIGAAGRLLVSDGHLLTQGIGGGAPLTEGSLPPAPHPLGEAAAGLLRVLRDDPVGSGVTGAWERGVGTVGRDQTGFSVAASLRDILIAEQVLVAAAESQSAGGWEEL
jgi:hypothetical protein